MARENRRALSNNKRPRCTSFWVVLYLFVTALHMARTIHSTDGVSLCVALLDCSMLFSYIVCLYVYAYINASCYNCVDSALTLEAACRFIISWYCPLSRYQAITLLSWPAFQEERLM
jgi:hypothetical protein